MADSAPATSALRQTVAGQHPIGMRRVLARPGPKPAPTPLRLLSISVILLIFVALTLNIPLSVYALQARQYIVCKNLDSQMCVTWLFKFENEKDMYDVLSPLAITNQFCGFSALKPIHPHRRLIMVKPLHGNLKSRPIFCNTLMVVTKEGFHLTDNTDAFRSIYRERRQTGYSPRGRYRGQTQSQYLAIERGNGKDEGKAEAHSAADSSRASVSGNSGMGQAQSQTIYDPSCDECYGRSDIDAANLSRRPGQTGENGLISQGIKPGGNVPASNQGSPDKNLIQNQYGNQGGSPSGGHGGFHTNGSNQGRNNGEVPANTYTPNQIIPGRTYPTNHIRAPDGGVQGVTPGGDFHGSMRGVIPSDGLQIGKPGIGFQGAPGTISQGQIPVGESQRGNNGLQGQVPQSQPGSVLHERMPTNVLHGMTPGGTIPGTDSQRGQPGISLQGLTPGIISQGGQPNIDSRSVQGLRPGGNLPGTVPSGPTAQGGIPNNIQNGQRNLFSQTTGGYIPGGPSIPSANGKGLIGSNWPLASGPIQGSDGSIYYCCIVNPNYGSGGYSLQPSSQNGQQGLYDSRLKPYDAGIQSVNGPYGSSTMGQQIPYGTTKQQIPFDAESKRQQMPYGTSVTGQQTPYVTGPTAPYGTGSTVQQAPYGTGTTGQQAPYGTGTTGQQAPYGTGTTGQQVPYGHGHTAQQTPYATDTTGQQIPYGISTTGQQTPYGTSVTSQQIPYGSSTTGQNVPYGTGITGQQTPYGTGTTGQRVPYGTGTTDQQTPYGTGISGQQTPYGTGPTSQQAPFGTGTTGQQTPYGTGPTGQQTPYGTGTRGQQIPYGTDTTGQQIPYGTGTTGQQTPYGTGTTGQRTPYDTGTTGQQTPYGTGTTGQQTPYGTGTIDQQMPYGTGTTGQQTPYGTGTTGQQIPYGTGTTGQQMPYGTGTTDQQTAFGTGTIGQQVPYGPGNTGQQAPYGTGTTGQQIPYGTGTTGQQLPYDTGSTGTLTQQIPYGTGGIGQQTPYNNGMRGSTGQQIPNGHNGYSYNEGNSVGQNNVQYGQTQGTGYDDQRKTGQGVDLTGEPQNVIDSNSILTDGDDSQAEASVSQGANGTVATASSNGGNDKSRAETNVQGTYTGTGSFSAQASISDDNKGAESQVSGSKRGASSNASGRGKKNKSQAAVELGSETGSIQTDSQSSGIMHSSNTQVQGSLKGGVADAQARGPGSTSSQAQIGFTPYKEGDKSHDLITRPFVGGGTASAHSSGRMGTSQSQLRGTFKYGITYNGAAQAGASLDKDAVFSNLQPFDKIDVYDKNNTNINVYDAETDTLSTTPFDVELTTERIYEEPLRPSEEKNSDHTHSDHHKSLEPLNTTNVSPIVGNRRAFPSAYGNNGDYEYNVDDNPTEEYDLEDVADGNDAGQTEQGEYSIYDNYARESDVTHESLHSPSQKGLDVRQTTGGNTQHILIGSLKNQDAKITQIKSERPDESKIYQPGERVPGMGGYVIPVGFTGSVKSVASKDKTYVVGSRGSPSQAQTVTLTPGTGKIKYIYPERYSKSVHPKDLRSLYNSKPVDNRYVSVSKSVTRDLDSENNIRKQYSHTYYTKSSSCGYFTFTCTMVSSSEGKKKVCKPKIPTNPDGTPMRC
ncbi:apomucin-like isoform X2 [Galleria mellonella]|uniref:Apomucin-like isoform X2 n=1 Tax=Galleria mellonella TaxID=7137 RepID=A0ABM3MMM7_GALME|nr:apomucin-like isoform X2 [Galleria mellonella]